MAHYVEKKPAFLEKIDNLHAVFASNLRIFSCNRSDKFAERDYHSLWKISAFFWEFNHAIFREEVISNIWFLVRALVILPESTRL